MHTLRKYTVFQALLVSGLLILSLLFIEPKLSAQEYNCGAYGVSTYQDNNCGQDEDSDLSDTGQPALVWIGVGSLLIIGGISSFFYTSRKKSKK